jgi:bacterioferritin-associated ferredoxin
LTSVVCRPTILIIVISIAMRGQGMYICLCRGITESAVRRLGEEGVVCPNILACELGLNEPDCCGRCLKRIEALTAMAQRHAHSHPTPSLGDRTTEAS